MDGLDKLFYEIPLAFQANDRSFMSFVGMAIPLCIHITYSCAVEGY